MITHDGTFTKTSLQRLGITRQELADDMTRLTGHRYNVEIIHHWCSTRGPSNAAVVYLKLKLEQMNGSKSEN